MTPTLLCCLWLPCTAVAKIDKVINFYKMKVTKLKVIVPVCGVQCLFHNDRDNLNERTQLISILILFEKSFIPTHTLVFSISWLVRAITLQSTVLCKSCAELYVLEVWHAGHCWPLVSAHTCSLQSPEDLSFSRLWRWKQPKKKPS